MVYNSLAEFSGFIGILYRDLSYSVRVLEKFGFGLTGRRFVDSEVAKGSGVLGMHHPLRNALSVKVGDLLDELEIL
jgi:hypothetical protein